MTECHAALAVFVKTPGLSPVKTRLAEGIGRERAEEFFALSLAAVEATAATVAESSGVCPYWAVAEECGLENPRWQRFARIYQGPGNLGNRLDYVFAELQLRHKIVVAIGADSPQITPRIIREAVEYLRKDSPCIAHVIGRCHDGGFYLVGTNHSLSANTWCNVPYGTQEAADRLGANLARCGQITELPTRTDVDRVEDLAILANELNAIPNPSGQQLTILNWITRERRVLRTARR